MPGTGSQYSRINVPSGVPGPTRVIRSLSDLLSIEYSNAGNGPGLEVYLTGAWPTAIRRLRLVLAEVLGGELHFALHACQITHRERPLTHVLALVWCVLVLGGHAQNDQVLV